MWVEKRSVYSSKWEGVGDRKYEGGGWSLRYEGVTEYMITDTTIELSNDMQLKQKQKNKEVFPHDCRGELEGVSCEEC